MYTSAEAQKRSNAMEAPTWGGLRTGWRDQRCLSGQVAFGLDLERERRFLHVEKTLIRMSAIVERINSNKVMFSNHKTIKLEISNTMIILPCLKINCMIIC